MNAKIMIAVAFLLVLLGGIGYVMWARQSVKGPVTNSVKNTIMQDKPATQSMSFKDLLTKNITQKCTFTDKNESANVSGETYIKNGTMRGIITTMAGGKTIKSNMIVNSKTAMMWMDGQKTGYTYSIESMNAQVTGAPTKDELVDLSKNYNYKCEPWTSDDSLFTAPKDITFTDFSSMMQKNSGSGAMMNQDTKCAACNYLSGEQQTQCKQALGCP